MKAFKLSSLCTVVGFFLTIAFSQMTLALTCTAPAGMSGVTRSTNCANRFSGNAAQISACDEYVGCLADKKEEDDRLRSEADSNTSRCEGYLSSYQTANSQTATECAKSGVASVNSCIQAANACSGNFSGISDSTSDNPLSAAMNLLSIANSIGSTPSSSSECTIDEEADKKQQTADKIQQLRDEQQESVTKQAELDGEIADKQKEINEEIRKNKDDIQQSLRDLDKEDREKFATIQKALLESKKKKFKNLIAINKINTEIANLEFAQQQINIEFSESKIARKCYEKVLETKKKLVPEAGPAVPGQPAPVNPARNFTLKEAQKIKQQLRDEESDCLKTERLSRSAQLKGKIDRRQELTDQITQANQDIADEDAAIKLDQEDYDKFKASMADEKKSKLDSQTQMEANLNASLASFQALVEKKKAALDAKIKSREENIQNLLTAKTNQKQRYSEVSASLFTRQESLNTFLSSCCNSTSRSTTGLSSAAIALRNNCNRLKSDSSGNTLQEPATGGSSNSNR